MKKFKEYYNFPYADLTSKPMADLNAAKFSNDMINKLKKTYEPLKGKKINPTPLMKVFDKIDSNKDGLIQLYKADIPFVSTMAMSRLMLKHNYKASDINKLGKIRREDFVDEKYDSDKFFGGKGTPEQRLQLLKLTNKALSTLGGSPKQNAIKKEIDALRKKMGMKVKEEFELDERYMSGGIRIVFDEDPFGGKKMSIITNNGVLDIPNSQHRNFLKLIRRVSEKDFK